MKNAWDAVKKSAGIFNSRWRVYELNSYTASIVGAVKRLKVLFCCIGKLV
ncbi:MAG TPA: hypothetical protein GXX15_05350 [Clostridia bacterium]|nr:hypothetical protein [Clostridia bacterium]